MPDHPYHFITLPPINRENVHMERGINLSQVISYEYQDHASDGMPAMTLVISGGERVDFRCEDAKILYRSIRGKW